MNKIVEQTLVTVSDLTTAGIAGDIISLVSKLPQGVQNLVALGLPALACTYNTISRINNQRIQKKDYEKISKLIEELKQEMEIRKIKDLQKFIGLDISTEEYAAIEELVKEAINSKNIWIRKLAASMLVTVGSEEENDLRGFQRCIRVIKELDDLDIRLLIIHMNIHYNREGNDTLRKESEQLKKDLIEDDTIYAQSINVSSKRLSLLGLVSHECSMHPYDGSDCNKADIIGDFIAQNSSDVTPYLVLFQRFVNGTLRSKQQLQ
ncbi:hypothetical protein [Clostridium sp. JN-1]|uniref:hypothetical protein n=1 Tax=Clostridium sp. JN-1 TaxID=2483110 RepID=UPI000F0B5743|nr:hypothetical protein [Clostridium sp. JN-1]